MVEARERERRERRRASACGCIISHFSRRKQYLAVLKEGVQVFCRQPQVLLGRSRVAKRPCPADSAQDCQSTRCGVEVKARSEQKGGKDGVAAVGRECVRNGESQGKEGMETGGKERRKKEER
eukprot:1150391-Rhodomonas_salina.2